MFAQYGVILKQLGFEVAFVGNIGVMLAMYVAAVVATVAVALETFVANVVITVAVGT